ncbi:MAG: thioredoxin family protein [Gammaproteobacteria bacterium]|nr:thioredoxin family protein [Gammaproteobacteria bacterium]MBU1654814.1 thioredoxin family protein [Gammaproteobacteria bacterium]MBU1961081.1 thioredoxin family protein [Gammaproteobacteria bacterium]
MRKLFPVLLISLFLAGTAFALGRPFDPAAFESLRQKGGPVLVAIHADWCPTCKAQERALGGLLETPEFKGIHLFLVDFDTQQEIMRGFKAKVQGTLILFRGGDEAGRSVGETTPEGIAALLRKGARP